MTFDEVNEIACQIIAFSGEGKSYAMEALENAELGEFEEANENLRLCNESILKAHEIHTQLLVEEARNPGKLSMTMMLIHASNHLSGAEITRDLTERFIGLYQRIK